MATLASHSTVVHVKHLNLDSMGNISFKTLETSRKGHVYPF